MTKKTILEFVPLALFLLSATGVLFKLLPSAGMIAVISCSALAMVYFYASAWLFAERITSNVTKIVIGVLFAISLIGCLFALMRWPYWQLYCIFGFISLSIALFIYLFNYKAPGYKFLLYRGLLYLLILLAIYGFRSHWF